MDIKYYEMSDRDKELAVHLAPQEQLDRLSLAKHGGFLAVDEEKEQAVGVLIYSYARAERLDIEWLYVQEEYRYHEIGGELLIAVYDLAMSVGVSSVGVRMTGELAAKENIDAANDYLEPRGFVSGMYAEGDWIIKKEELKRFATAGEKYRSASVFPVSRISSVKLKAFLKDHWNVLKQSPLYTYQSALADMDTQLSVAYMTPEGEIDALMLVQRVGDIVYPITFYMCHPKDAVFLAMAVAVIDEIRKMPGDAVCHVVYSRRAVTLLLKLFRTHIAQRTYQFLAPADYYEQDKKRKEESDFSYPDLFYEEVPSELTCIGFETYGSRTY